MLMISIKIKEWKILWLPDSIIIRPTAPAKRNAKEKKERRKRKKREGMMTKVEK